MLSAEAGSFLKAKVMRFSTPWIAPRIVLFATSIHKALAWNGFVDAIFYLIERATVGSITVRNTEETMNAGCQVSK